MTIWVSLVIYAKKNTYILFLFKNYDDISMIQLATLIYVQDTKNNKTLMMLRNKKENDVHEWKRNGLWGKVEKGESPDACCRRELQEESGLIAKDITLKGILTAPQFSHDKDRYVFIYNVTSREGVLDEDSNEGELHRIESDKLLELNLREGDKKFIPLLFEENIFEATMQYKNWELEKFIIS